MCPSLQSHNRALGRSASMQAATRFRQPCHQLLGTRNTFQNNHQLLAAAENSLCLQQGAPRDRGAARSGSGEGCLPEVQTVAFSPGLPHGRREGGSKLSGVSF